MTYHGYFTQSGVICHTAHCPALARLLSAADSSDRGFVHRFHWRARQYLALPGVRGKGMASRTLARPVT
jgi:hypothetical protein